MSAVLYQMPAQTNNVSDNNSAAAVVATYEVIQEDCFSHLSQLAEDSSENKSAGSDSSDDGVMVASRKGSAILKFKFYHVRTPGKAEDFFAFVISRHREHKLQSFTRHTRVEFQHLYNLCATELKKLTEPVQK